MAWQNPKTDWASEDGVLNTDFNRIEGNIAYLKDNASGALSATVTYYVATTGSNSNDGLSAAAPFATIQKALDSIPKNLNGYNGHVVIAGGSYTGGVSVDGFFGGTVTFSNRNNENIAIVGSMSITNCVNVTFSSMARLSVTGNVTVSSTLQVYFGVATQITNTQFEALKVSNANVTFNGTLTTLAASYSPGILAEANACIYTETVVITTGTGIGLKADFGGFIRYGAATNNATTKTQTARGGRIYSGAQSSVPAY